MSCSLIDARVKYTENYGTEVYDMTSLTSQKGDAEFDDELQRMSVETEDRREMLEQQMVANLIKIAEMTGRPIRQMQLNENGVFEEKTN